MKPGQLIRHVRLGQGVSQARLARRAGTSQAAVSDIERGRVSPTVETIERLLLCMGYELSTDARPLPLDADTESLRALRRLEPHERLRRLTRASRLVQRGRQAVVDGDG